MDAGEEHGALTTIIRDPRKPRREYWLCECTCGNIVSKHWSTLTERSYCGPGCTSRLKAKHGLSNTPVYRAWDNLQRKRKKEEVKVTKKWKTVKDFVRDMGYPKENHILSLIDKEGIYEPGNCKWEPYQGNLDQIKFITYDGKTQSHGSWSRELGGSSDLVSSRIRRGWSEERAVTTPVNK